MIGLLYLLVRAHWRFYSSVAIPTDVAGELLFFDRVIDMSARDFIKLSVCSSFNAAVCIYCLAEGRYSILAAASGGIAVQSALGAFYTAAMEVLEKKVIRVRLDELSPRKWIAPSIDSPKVRS